MARASGKTAAIVRVRPGNRTDMGMSLLRTVSCGRTAFMA